MVTQDASSISFITNLLSNFRLKPAHYQVEIAIIIIIINDLGQQCGIYGLLKLNPYTRTYVGIAVGTYHITKANCYLFVIII